jgi:hypothetical protein
MLEILLEILIFFVFASILHFVIRLIKINNLGLAMALAFIIWSFYRFIIAYAPVLNMEGMRYIPIYIAALPVSLFIGLQESVLESESIIKFDTATSEYIARAIIPFILYSIFGGLQYYLIGWGLQRGLKKLTEKKKLKE